MIIILIALVAIIAGLIGSSIYRARAHARQTAFMAKQYAILDANYENQGAYATGLVQEISRITSGTFAIDLKEANDQLAAAEKTIDTMKYDKHQREIGVQEIVESYENHNLEQIARIVELETQVDMYLEENQELAAREIRHEWIYAWFRDKYDTDIPLDVLRDIMVKVRKTYPNAEDPMALENDVSGG